MAWKKIPLTLTDGSVVQAQAPEIVSASRSTDIPAFYADWFFDRLKAGYSAWTNPFNGVKSYIAYKNTRFIVFWSKNPHPLISHLDELQELGIKCYVQYSLNDYEKEGLENGVPSLSSRIDTFKELADMLGLGGVIWRFDPLVLTDKISTNDLLDKVERIGNELYGYTEKLVFSFADIAIYKKVKRNLINDHVNYNEWTEEQMLSFANELVKLNEKWHYQLATCAEKINLPGVDHNKCIDDELIIKRGWQDSQLMKFLNVDIKLRQQDLFSKVDDIPTNAIELDGSHYAIRKKDNKDKGQRQFCGCIISKDIGQYNTCPHLCEYCYANTSKDAALRNYKSHKENPNKETII